MKNVPLAQKSLTAVVILSFLSLTLVTCKKEDKIVELNGTPVTGNGLVDIFWSNDKPHSNVCWETNYMDYSVGKLTGRFNEFGFSPKFIFDQANLGNSRIHAYVLISSIDSGEPLRDAVGKCIRSYMGQTYLDTLKTIVDPASDTAWFHSDDIRASGNGYVAIGTFSFNRYRTPSGNPDGTAITKPCLFFFTYNGTQDFDTDGDFINDKLRASFTGHFSFLRSDHMDTASTIQYIPVPALIDLPGNTIAANNTTYGVWTTNVADQMDLTLNMQFYKNH